MNMNIDHSIHDDDDEDDEEEEEEEEEEDDDDDDVENQSPVKPYKGTQAKITCEREEQKQHRRRTSPTDKTKTRYTVSFFRWGVSVYTNTIVYQPGKPRD